MEQLLYDYFLHSIYINTLELKNQKRRNEKARSFSGKPDVFKFAVLMVKREINRIILFQHIPAFLATTPNKHVVGKLLVAPQLPLNHWIAWIANITHQ